MNRAADDTTLSCTSKAGLRHIAASRLTRFWYTPLKSSSHGFIIPLTSLSTHIYVKGLEHHQNHMKRLSRRLAAPVISVGNLVAGGTGKTPFTIWLASYLHRHSRRPAVLSRGYGGSGVNSARVPSQGDTLPQVLRYGDEPVLMARRLSQIPVWAGRDRWTSGDLAIRNCRSDLLILDDGFQHLRLARDMDIVLLDSANPFGNGLLLPFGPLREPINHLQRADMIILTRAEATADRAAAMQAKIKVSFPHKPVFACRHLPTGFRLGMNGPSIPLPAIKGETAVAFAAIDRPERFFCSLRGLGVRLAGCFGFPDHHVYRVDDFCRLLAIMRKSRARFLITTEKDMVRLPPELQAIVLAVELTLDMGADHDGLCSFLDERIGRL